MTVNIVICGRIDTVKHGLRCIVELEQGLIISMFITNSLNNVNQKDMEQGNNESKKNDRLDDKLRWELLPLEDLEDIVKVYTAGAKKYGPNTWQNLPDGYNRYKAAFFRHLLEHEKGNWLDEETGSIHLAQCVWNAIAMLHIAKQNMKNNENTICSKKENLLTERKDTPEK